MVDRTDRKNVQKAAFGLGREGEVDLPAVFRSFTLTESLKQAIQRVTQLVCLIRRWMVIYPVNRAIQRLN